MRNVAPFPGVGLDAHSAAMRRYQGGHDGQAEAAAARRLVRAWSAR